MAQQFIRLNNGVDYPSLGFGTWRSEKNETKKAVIEAIHCGYRHIDCASVYISLKSLFSFNGCLDCSTPMRARIADYDPNQVETACRASLERLGLDYVDLYLMHWQVKQVADDPTHPEITRTIPFSLEWAVPTWRAMEALVVKGLVKAIGICNFGQKRLEEFLPHCQINPSMLQNEIHPELSQAPLLAFCRSRGIQMTAYSPLGNPGCSEEMKAPGYPEPLKEPKVLAIAKSHGKTPAQILLRWGVQRGTSVIPKSVNPARIRENAAIFDFSLTEEDMRTMDSLECNGRIFSGSFWFPKDPQEIAAFWA